MSQKILITGGAGFIGSNFAHYTAEHHPEDDIVVIDKLTYAGNKQNLASLLASKKITFVKGDIADKKCIASLFKKHRFSAVVNFAAETHVDRSIATPSIFVMTNIVGTHNLLEASRQYGVPRYHQISTDEVYGDLGDNSKQYFTEKTHLAPNSPYAASKAAADLLVSSYHKTYGLFTTINRCSNNYGHYQFPEKLIPFFFTKAELGEPLPLYGDGKNIRDWLFVEDHCEAIDLILRKGKSGEIYNVGGHNEKQNIEIAKLILKFLGKPESLITYVSDRLAHDRRYAIDPSKIERELSWKAKTSFEEGIKITFEWYRKNTAWRSSVSRKHVPLKKSPSRKFLREMSART